MSTTLIHPFDLDPSLVDRRTYTTRRRPHLLDAAALVAAAAALAILIPAHLVLPALGGIGRPVTVFSVVLAAGWFVMKLHPRLSFPGPQPLRWAAAMYLAAMLAAYTAGFMRGLPPIEANAADRTMIIGLAFVGLAVVCADGVANRTRLDNLLRILVLLGTVMALIGHLQFVLGLNLVEYIRLPGLVDHRDVADFRARGAGFFQVASTATHYIEFSTVMAMLVPLAVHFARYSPQRLARQAAAVAAVLIAVAIPITLSRTGFVGVAVAMLVLSAFWTWRTRFNMAIIAAGLVAAVMLIQPGLLGTVRALFLQAADDPSIQGRTEDYGPAFEYISDRPWFGRGPGTFIPTLYRFIDNDWLIHLITVGIVGTAAYAAWHITGITLAAIAYRRSRRDADRHLCATLIAVQVSAMAVAFFFDALAFATHTTVLSILTGAAGAMWRLTHPRRQVRSAGTRLGRLWPVRFRRPAASRPHPVA